MRGLAYTALFALFAALAIGYTIFMAVLGGNERLRGDLLGEINKAIPGLIDIGDGSGGAIKPDALLLTASSLAGVIAALVLLWTVMSFMSALRGAVRIMLGLAREPVNFVVGKAKDLSAFLVLLVAVVASSAVSVVATSASSWLVRTLGLPDGVSGLVSAVGLAVAGVIDVLVVVYVLRVLGARAPAGRTRCGAPSWPPSCSGAALPRDERDRRERLEERAAGVVRRHRHGAAARQLRRARAPARRRVDLRPGARRRLPASRAPAGRPGRGGAGRERDRRVGRHGGGAVRRRRAASPARESGPWAGGWAPGDDDGRPPPQEDDRPSWWSRLLGRLRPGRLRRRG
ncbi:hypothetical protein GCM10025864_01310 [Luteimicrobium album]|uniref:YihY/virulence factor BrkB family protein n=1 Tax=Luteimicrobium album TaxID=1054550 RepID=A0ABQ6HW45_9MICO|nr:YhjD/YihY/BrkB family envelope integrity protein [Luteimicrobium album]GMA22372.1 hypothetical protein GCM10025864_01310 [Luteimicrobium album]